MAAVSSGHIQGILSFLSSLALSLSKFKPHNHESLGFFLHCIMLSLFAFMNLICHIVAYSFSVWRSSWSSSQSGLVFHHPE